MQQNNFKVYPYRWVVLLAFMGIIAVNQLLWITFAPITSNAVEFTKFLSSVSELLSLIFLIVYIFVSFPASWVIDTYGIRIGVGIGAALTGIFGLMRGLVASDYKLVLVAQIGIAIGQPFILNAVTTVAARWFPKGRTGNCNRLGLTGHLFGNPCRACSDSLSCDSLRHFWCADQLWDCFDPCHGDVFPVHPRASAFPSLSSRSGRSFPGVGWLVKNDSST